MDTKNAPAVLRGLLCSIIVMSLPTGVGVALIALASALPWRLAALRGPAPKPRQRACVTCASRSGLQPSRAWMARRLQVSIWAGVRRI